MKVTFAWLALLGLWDAVQGDALPYNPTHIYVPINSTRAYIFQGRADLVTQTRLWTLDISTDIVSTGYATNTLFDSLPFLDDEELRPYTPAPGANGTIMVIAGNCSDAVNGTQIWSYIPAAAGSKDVGTWEQYQTVNASEGGAALSGSSYLAGGVAFSQYVESNGSDTSVYSFGGMCPFDNSTADTWQASATYSDEMLVAAAGDSGSSRADNATFTMGTTASRGPPIAEAGFSINALEPTYSAVVSGEAQTKQQNFVLLGGHTESAFINMSQVALLSLPQESWTFLPVNQPSSSDSTSEVEPRSGHSTVLTEDGTRLIVYGGWVGDVHTPAQPQLAVLAVGSGYGGTDQWSWSIPSPSSNGLVAAGTGIYGHGAAMLPGGVMMVLGGFTIAAPSSRFIKRQTQVTNTDMYFYNTSSGSWLDSYSPPVKYTSQSDHASTPLDSKSKQIGLGAGLGIGALILIALILFYLWYTRRLKKSRQNKERALLSRSSYSSIAHIDQPFLADGGIDGRGGDAAGVGRFWNVWDSATGTYPQRPEMQERDVAAGSTALSLDNPSPTRGLRKGVVARSYQYHAAPRYDDKRVSRGSGGIHTITEHVDEDEDGRPVSRATDAGLTEAEIKLKEIERLLSPTDPFSDPVPNPLGSHPVSPEPEEVPSFGTVGTRRISSLPRVLAATNRNSGQDWSKDFGVGGSDIAHREYTGRISPTKSDERTSSTLSDRSNGTPSFTRTMSTRTGALLAAAVAARMTSNTSPEHSQSSSEDRSRTMSTTGGRKSPFFSHGRARSESDDSIQAGALSTKSDADSFMTAKSTFATLQTEGETLLGGRRPAMDRDDPYQRALAAHSSINAPKLRNVYDGSLQRDTAPARRRQGWMGSLRRAINAVAVGERTFSFTSAQEQALHNQRSSSTSPTKDRPVRRSNVPRRAVSDGAALLRQKRGQKDWEDGQQWPPYRDDPDAGDWGAPRSPAHDEQAEQDWDVEGAASKRDVQMMFTVPKARLRVVNADLERAGKFEEYQ